MTATSLFAASCGLLDFETAVLILVTLGVLVLAKMVSDLRGEVRALRRTQTDPRPAPSPGATVSAPRNEQGNAHMAPAPEEIPADVYAAIVAAVHYTLGQEHHLVSVTPGETLMWSREGRRNIFSSHSFR